jgi:hypothetical protein
MANDGDPFASRLWERGRAALGSKEGIAAVAGVLAGMVALTRPIRRGTAAALADLTGVEVPSWLVPSLVAFLVVIVVLAALTRLE